MKGLLFTLALSYGGAVVGLFEPFVGFLAYVMLANLRPEYIWFWAVPPNGNYSRVVAGGMLLGWAMKEFLAARQREPQASLSASVAGFALRPLLALTGLVSGTRVGEFGKARAVIACLAGFWFWVILSGALARDQVIADNFIDIFSKIFLPVIVGICLIDSVGKLRMLAWTLMLSQAYIAFEANLSYYQGYNRLLYDGMGGMDNNSASIGMVTGFGLAFFLGLYSPRLWQQLLAFGCAVLLAHSVMFAMSRGAMLALIITGVISFLLIRKTTKHYAILLVAVLIGLRLAGAEVRERFFTLFASAEERDASAESRIKLWGACWDVMNKNPVFGVGPDHWASQSHRYGFTAGKEAHTLWLQVGAETGVVGLGLLVSYYGICVFRLWPLARGRLPEGADPWLSYLACAVIAALVGFGVSAQFVSLKLLEIPYYVALLGAGVLKVSSVRAAEKAPEAPRQLVPLPGAV